MKDILLSRLNVVHLHIEQETLCEMRIYFFIENVIRFNKKSYTSFFLGNIYNFIVQLLRFFTLLKLLSHLEQYNESRNGYIFFVSYLLCVTFPLRFLYVSFYTLLSSTFTEIIPKMRKMAKAMKVVLICCFLKDKSGSIAVCIRNIVLMAGKGSFCSYKFSQQFARYVAMRDV